MNSLIKRLIKSYLEEKEQGNSKGKRKMSKSYCEKTPCLSPAWLLIEIKYQQYR